MHLGIFCYQSDYCKILVKSKSCVVYNAIHINFNMRSFFLLVFVLIVRTVAYIRSFCPLSIAVSHFAAHVSTSMYAIRKDDMALPAKIITHYAKNNMLLHAKIITHYATISGASRLRNTHYARV